MDNAGGVLVAGAKSATTHLVQALFFGTFNPAYPKDDQADPCLYTYLALQKRIRYIQSKYAQAYGKEAGVDTDAIISSIDPASRLRMTQDGTKPSNPFPHERAFEESLQIQLNPIPGHQGRFAASHAMVSIGKISEYQLQRRKRQWIPGVQSPGRPNDYVNMFLDELKTWLRTQMTLDNVAAEELQRREVYMSKLKHDQYYWCFPLEKAQYNIHDVIDFVHKKVLDALEVVQREEQNKSMQHLFKELNDHTTNLFEFGKHFLAYLLAATKKAGSDLTSSANFNGESNEMGRLYRLLERNTDPVMKMYVAEIRNTELRLEAQSSSTAAIGNAAANSKRLPEATPLLSYEPSARRASEGSAGRGGGNDGAAAGGSGGSSLSLFNHGMYTIEDPIRMEDAGLLKGMTYVIRVTDPRGITWVLRKKFADFEALLKEIQSHNLDIDHDRVNDSFPGKFTSIIKPTQAGMDERASGVRSFLLAVLAEIPALEDKSRQYLCEFMEVKTLFDPPTRIVHAETIPNSFVELKQAFLALVTEPERKKPTTEEKMLIVLRQSWGVDPTVRILEAHALLQRMATCLGLSLEINHFFLSMFGNTLAFSKLPLRDLLLTLKDIMAKFLATAQDLFASACQLNAEQHYTWHKNLRQTEYHLGLVRHHCDRALAVIAKIETEHLDYDAQLKRLQDVAQRFTPLMSRLDYSLPQIQSELGLPQRVDAIKDETSGSASLTLPHAEKSLRMAPQSTRHDGAYSHPSGCIVEEVPDHAPQSMNSSTALSVHGSAPSAAAQPSAHSSSSRPALQPQGSGNRNSNKDLNEGSVLSSSGTSDLSAAMGSSKDKPITGPMGWMIQRRSLTLRPDTKVHPT